MIHDLDVLLATVGAEVVQIEAVGVPVLTNRVDIANARLKFANGCIANLTASRISREPVRKVRFFQPHSYVSIDYASKELEVWRLQLGEGGSAAIEGGKMEVPQEEPLKLELQDFVQAVRSKQAPRVTGHDGRRALELAQRITRLHQRRVGDDELLCSILRQSSRPAGAICRRGCAAARRDDRSRDCRHGRRRKRAACTAATA